MSRIRTIMLSLLAVFALGAIASSSALAVAPEFVRCVAHAGGGFAAGCKVTGAGFEKEAVPAGSHIKFTSTSEPSYLFANAAGTFRITCATDTDTGEITGPKIVGKVKVIFKECKGYKGANECTVHSVSPLGGAGEIITNELSGELSPVAAAEAPDSEVGLDLKATVAGKPFVLLVGSVVACIPETAVEGTVIGELEPVKIMESFGELIFSVDGGAGKHNKQGIQKDVGGTKDTLEAFGGLEVGFESEDSITFEEGIEVT
jgi:hypothetical protein